MGEPAKEIEITVNLSRLDMQLLELAAHLTGKTREQFAKDAVLKAAGMLSDEHT